MELVIFKKMSKKTNKAYYEVCEVEKGKFKKLGFASYCDKTK